MVKKTWTTCSCITSLLLVVGALFHYILLILLVSLMKFFVDFKRQLQVPFFLHGDHYSTLLKRWSIWSDRNDALFPEEFNLL